MENLVTSFVNYSFMVGEWLVKKEALTNDMIEEMGNDIILGIPSLAILHCIEKSSNFDDGKIHFATGTSLHPVWNPFDEDFKKLFKLISKGVEIYKSIEFNYESYDQFRINVIKKSNEFSGEGMDIEFTGQENELYKVIYAVALSISQIKEYKDNYLHVISLLQTIE